MNILVLVSLVTIALAEYPRINSYDEYNRLWFEQVPPGWIHNVTYLAKRNELCNS
jgi:hypothetical protein